MTRKRIIAAVLCACLCAALLSACGSKSSSSTAASGETTATVTPQRLGIITDRELSDDDIESICAEYSISYSNYDDYIVLITSDPYEAELAAADLTDQNCSTIIYDAVGTSEAAEYFSAQYPEIAVVVTDNALLVTPIIEEQYVIEEALTNFSNDRAWVSYRDYDNNLKYGLIDLSGFIVWSVDADSLEGWGSVTGISTAEGTCCIFPDNSRAFHYSPGMIVVGSNGQVIFDSRESGDGVSFYYLGYGEGTYLAIRHEESFSVNAFFLCEISDKGEITSQINWPDDWTGRGIVDSMYHLNQDFSYFGDGIYFGSQTTGYTLEYGALWIYDSVNKHFYRTKDKYGTYLQLIDEVALGKVIFEEMDDIIGSASFNETHKYYVLDKESLYNDTTGYQIAEEQVPVRGSYGEELIHGWSTSGAPGVYDYSGTLLFEYPADWNIVEVAPFDGGYAPIFLKGADEETYITVVDAAGAVQYNPQKIDSYTLPAWHGYVLVTLDGNDVIISPDGRVTSRSELSAISQDYTIGRRKSDNYGTVSCGYSRIYDDSKDRFVSYVSADGNQINMVYVVSNYDKLAETRYSVHEPESETSQETGIQKSYTSVSNFTIEGKWKNVGTNTFGQAQAGAIIVFDGSNCNFYSPKDTYAFYKDGDSYKLDCTSLLAETLSFTVKIIDDDNIDIYYGGGCLEMTRIK